MNEKLKTIGVESNNLEELTRLINTFSESNDTRFVQTHITTINTIPNGSKILYSAIIYYNPEQIKDDLKNRKEGRT